MPSQIEERAAAVAGVDRRVGLDEVVVGPGADRARLGAHDAHRHGVAETKRIADGHHVLADAQLLARAERDRRQIARTDQLEHREIEARVAALHLGVELAIVGELHAAPIGVFHDVRVGDHVPDAIDQKPRPKGLLAIDLIAAPTPRALRKHAERVEPKGD